MLEQISMHRVKLSLRQGEQVDSQSSVNSWCQYNPLIQACSISWALTHSVMYPLISTWDSFSVCRELLIHSRLRWIHAKPAAACNFSNSRTYYQNVHSLRTWERILYLVNHMSLVLVALSISSLPTVNSSQKKIWQLYQVNKAGTLQVESSMVSCFKATLSFRSLLIPNLDLKSVGSEKFCFS